MNIPPRLLATIRKKNKNNTIYISEYRIPGGTKTTGVSAHRQAGVNIHRNQSASFSAGQSAGQSAHLYIHYSEDYHAMAALYLM